MTPPSLVFICPASPLTSSSWQISFSMVPSFGYWLRENTNVSPLGGAATHASHLTNRLRLRASRSRFAMSERMHRAITSLTASSAHLWMSSFAIFISRFSGLSVPLFGLGFNV